MIFVKTSENIKLIEEEAKDRLQGATLKAHTYLSVVIP